MVEYIERAAVHDLVKRLPEYHMFSYDRTESLIGISPDDVDFGVDEIPAADVVEVRHGRWIVFDPKNAESKECSMCGYLFSRLYPSNYCPNCGARMDKKGCFPLSGPEKLSPLTKSSGRLMQRRNKNEHQ